MGPTSFRVQRYQPSVNASETMATPGNMGGIANFRPVGRHNPVKKKRSSGRVCGRGTVSVRRGPRPGSDSAALSSILGRGVGGPIRECGLALRSGTGGFA
jgi:hypothetical protein